MSRSKRAGQKSVIEREAPKTKGRIQLAATRTGITPFALAIGDQTYYSSPSNPRGLQRPQLVAFINRTGNPPTAYAPMSMNWEPTNINASAPALRADVNLIDDVYEMLYPNLLEVALGRGIPVDDTDIAANVEIDQLSTWKYCMEKVWPLVAIVTSEHEFPVLQAIRRAFRTSGRVTRLRNVWEDLTTLFNVPDLYWQPIDRYCTPTQADADSPFFFYGGSLPSTDDNYLSGTEIDSILTDLETYVGQLRSTADKLSFWTLVNTLLPKPNIPIPELRVDAGVVAEWTVSGYSYEVAAGGTVYASPSLDLFNDTLEVFVPTEGIVPSWYMTLFRPQVAFSTESGPGAVYGYFPTNHGSGSAGHGASCMSIYSGYPGSEAQSQTSMNVVVGPTNIDTQMWNAFPHARRAMGNGTGSFQGFVHPTGFNVDVPFSTIVQNTLIAIRQAWYGGLGI